MDGRAKGYAASLSLYLVDGSRPTRSVSIGGRYMKAATPEQKWRSCIPSYHYFAATGLVYNIPSMMRSKLCSLAAAALLQSAAADYVWPQITDNLEDLAYLQDGYIKFGFIDGINPCGFGSLVPGRQNSAEWLRTAFHDMATHDASTGDGGLDASIMFETERPENKGGAFNNTFGFFFSFYNSRASAADLLALSVVVATNMCEGPLIPFRAGRVDATSAGPSGVPEPSQDLNTHVAKFAAAGFNVSDMIEMTMCGHTLGGMHPVNFPEAFEPGNYTAANVSHFDTTSAVFDNVVAAQYLDSSTANPLVVSPNDTMNSDKRIFGADGNKTVTALAAESATFMARCASIFERMINTVPSTVSLSDPIGPIDIKPYISELSVKPNGTLSFAGRIRVRVSHDTGRDPEDLAVVLNYKDRSGADGGKIATVRPQLLLGQSTGLKEVFNWYEFDTTIPGDKGISSFTIDLKSNSSDISKTFDNGGNGYPIQDAVLYQINYSCINSTEVDGHFNTTVTAAVRRDRLQDDLKMAIDIRRERQGVVLPAIETDDMEMKSTGVNMGEYVLYQLSVMLSATSVQTNFDLVLGDGDTEARVQFQSTPALSQQGCQVLPK